MGRWSSTKLSQVLTVKIVKIDRARGETTHCVSSELVNSSDDGARLLWLVFRQVKHN